MGRATCRRRTPIAFRRRSTSLAIPARGTLDAAAPGYPGPLELDLNGAAEGLRQVGGSPFFSFRTDRAVVIESRKKASWRALCAISCFPRPGPRQCSRACSAGRKTKRPGGRLVRVRVALRMTCSAVCPGAALVKVLPWPRAIVRRPGDSPGARPNVPQGSCGPHCSLTCCVNEGVPNHEARTVAKWRSGRA
jgi:hypothetical protein